MPTTGFFHKKTKFRIFAAVMTALALGMTFLAYKQEGTGGYYLWVSIAASLFAGFLALKIFPGRNAVGAARVFRVLFHFVVTVGTPFAALLLLQNFTLDPLRIYPMMMAVNAIFYYLFYLFLTFLTGSFAAGYVTADIIFLIIGTANYFVVQFRGSPIVPWDLFSVGTAASVAGNYSYEILWRFVFSGMGFLFLIILNVKLQMKLHMVFVRAAGVLLCAGGLVFACMQLQKTEVKESIGMDMTLFTPNVRYRNNGFLAAFLGNLHLINVQEPDGYSVSRVKQIEEEIREKNAESAGRNTRETAQKKLAAGELPNIVVIVDEAFSDLQVLGQFRTDVDYMPNFHRMMRECDSGYMMVSVKGGNTANTEFEFLSGDTMGFLPSGSVVYQQFIRDNIPVLPSYLASLGYETTGIHPYQGTGWDRDKVYPLLGFEEFLTEDDFQDPERIRLYISDQAAFDKITQVLEQNRANGPQFIFEVTMQNHSGYSKEYPGFTETVHLEDVKVETVQTRAAEKYLTLVRYSDEALGNMMEYFNEIEEPTILVMFGDHQPSDYVTNVIDRLVGYDPEISLEEAQKSFQVPYFVWNNFGMQMEDHDLLSVNYLAADILEAAGIPLTQYHEFLLDLQKSIPVICAGAYVDNDGNYHGLTEKSEENKVYEELLNRYNILQYNHMTDIRNRVTELFAKPAGDVETGG